MAVGMSADDIKANTNLILESAEINEIPSDGVVSLNIDEEGIAHIPVTGFLTRTHVTSSAAFETQAVTTYNFIIESSRLVDENLDVEKAIFEFNTGGGDVDGAEAAAIAIANIKKPTTARVHSSAQSSGILLASQTDRIIAIGKMSMFGSIGVVAEFKDRSKAEEQEGTKSIILTSNDAPEKRVDITTDKGQQSVIKLMDEIHLEMAKHIARGRNVTVDFVNKKFGRGGTMTAERALEVGLIDGIESNQNIKTKSISAKTIQATSPIILKTQNSEDTMTKMLSDFIDSNPEAKSEFEQLILNAKSDGGKTALSDLKVHSEKITPILLSGEYTSRIKEAGLQVYTGERTFQSFSDLVALSDEMTEKEKSKTIQKDQPEGTPGEGGPTAKESAQSEMKAGAQETAKSIGV